MRSYPRAVWRAKSIMVNCHLNHSRPTDLTVLRIPRRRWRWSIASDKERGHVPRSLPLSESCARCRSLRYRPLALDSLRAFRSGDVAEAALVAARNLPGRFGAGDDIQEILKSFDE